MKKKLLFTAILAAAISVIIPTETTKAADGTTVVATATATTVKSGKWLPGGGWWYQYTDGTFPKDTFAEINGKTYYFDKSGYTVTGWQTINYYSYYFDSNGAMVTGWYHRVEVSEGNTYYDEWFYTDADSQGHVGWLCYNGSWYYFKQGKMQRNCIAPDGSYLGADGISRKIR